MNPTSEIITKDLVLIGGGHSHVAVIKNFGMNPLPGVRLTVIARDVHTPYSGMLPGYVAGHYTYDEAHVDLRPLCRFAGARLFHDEAVGLDTDAMRVTCAGRPPVPYDLLSVNIGSRPQVGAVPGAEQFSTPVKPINRFVDKWHRLTERVMSQPGPHRVCIVGAGAAGVEMVLAIQFRLGTMLAAAGRDGEAVTCHLVSRTPRILPRFPSDVAARFERVLAARGVVVHLGTEASSIEPGVVVLSDGERIDADEVLLITGASAPAWLGEAGLDVDAEGFVKVDDCLRATSHPEIFAAGDVAAVVNHPREKAGVFAVRQGPPLADNLRRVLKGEDPKRFRPQRTALALISTGDKYAIAAKAGLSIEGAYLWRWKDWIDRRWMAKYADLPSMGAGEADDAGMRCGGCGAKVGAGVLSQALSGIDAGKAPGVLVGLDAPDDAAALQIPPGKVLIQSVDYFPSFIDDPYLFARVAANHALGDVFAMGAEAHSALAIVTVPYATEAKVADTVGQLMAGATEVLRGAGAQLIGGHTAEGSELALGFSVNGLVDAEALSRKTGMQPGDVLILTKPLGTGTLFAADMRGRAKGRWIEAALASMLRSNQAAARCLMAHGVHAMTDVTGFGLLGHLGEMLKTSDVRVTLHVGALPLIDGAVDAINDGIVSSLHPANLSNAPALDAPEDVVGLAGFQLLFDPQTAGGMLAAVPSENAGACLRALRECGDGEAAIIGEVGPQSGQATKLIIR